MTKTTTQAKKQAANQSGDTDNHLSHVEKLDKSIKMRLMARKLRTKLETAIENPTISKRPVVSRFYSKEELKAMDTVSPMNAATIRQLQNELALSPKKFAEIVEKMEANELTLPKKELEALRKLSIVNYCKTIPDLYLDHEIDHLVDQEIRNIIKEENLIISDKVIEQKDEEYREKLRRRMRLVVVSDDNIDLKYGEKLTEDNIRKLKEICRKNRETRERQTEKTRLLRQKSQFQSDPKKEVSSTSDTEEARTQRRSLASRILQNRIRSVFGSLNGNDQDVVTQFRLAYAGRTRSVLVKNGFVSASNDNAQFKGRVASDTLRLIARYNNNVMKSLLDFAQEHARLRQPLSKKGMSRPVVTVDDILQAKRDYGL